MYYIICILSMGAGTGPPSLRHDDVSNVTSRVWTGARPVLTCCQVIEVGVCDTSCLCMKLLKCNDSAS